MICLINEFKKIWNVKTIIILTLILAIINMLEQKEQIASQIGNQWQRKIVSWMRNT